MIYLIIYLALGLISLGMTIAKHGEPKEEKNNGWISFIALSIEWWLLYKAGLFNELFKLL